MTCLHKLILAGPVPLVVLQMPCSDTQDNLLHDVSQYQGQDDRSVVSWVLTLLVDGYEIC